MATTIAMSGKTCREVVVGKSDLNVVRPKSPTKEKPIAQAEKHVSSLEADLQEGDDEPAAKEDAATDVAMFFAP